MQLGRIEDMTAPDFGQAPAAYQIYACLPALQQGDEYLEASHLVSGDADLVSEFFGPVSRPWRAAFHVKRRIRLCCRTGAKTFYVTQKSRQGGGSDPGNSSRGA